ncbi:hypothetical protein BDK51DRAFT_17541, partial [Blyttiomyces helicus]
TQAVDLKTQGNAAFSSGDFKTAIELFSKAIELDPSNHVLYSNRSASYASLKEYQKAADDAEKTVQIKPDWAKGYSRKGAALHGLGDLDAAAAAYQEGLKIEPTNALLRKGLDDVEAEMSSGGGALGGLGKLLSGDVISKIRGIPSIAHFANEPDLMDKLRMVQGNPNLLNM